MVRSTACQQFTGKHLEKHGRYIRAHYTLGGWEEGEGNVAKC